MRSFSNLWYWIALAVLWSSVSHWVLGVPFDMIQRAKRKPNEATEDLVALVHINVKRLLYIRDVSGTWLLLFGSAALTVLIILGFWYGIEIAQALSFFAVPLAIIGMLSMRTARLIQEEDPGIAALHKRLGRHRFITQMIGVASIFATSMYGMWQNMAVGPLGG